CYEAATNTKVLPCAASNHSVIGALDVDELSNGEHVVQAFATDPASLVTESPAYRVLVDHVAPVAPQRLSLEGGQGWRGANRFGISWAAPAQVGSSPLQAAEYEFCPASTPPYSEVGCVHADKDVS